MELGITRLHVLADGEHDDEHGLRDTAIDGGTGPRCDVVLAPGSTLGRYVILERIGHGGMGVVYAAFDPELSRRIALKVLYPEPARDGSSAGPTRARMQREAQAMARVSHPNVISVFDVGELDDAVFVAMEFVEGPTLRQWVAQGSQTIAELVAVFVQAARGLAAAHAAGLVHRDFKPDNVIVGDDGLTRVLDFGLARTEASLGAGEPDEIVAPILPGARPSMPGGDMLSSQLTQAGAIVGTPSYMAPEQHAGVAADARCDQYGFCVALYEALFRRQPFEGATPELLARAKQRGVVRAATGGPAVPAHLAAAVLRGLAPDPADRWPDMHALLVALTRDPAARRRARLRMAAVATIAAAITAAAVLVALRTDAPCDDAQAQLAGTWDDATRSEVRRGILAVDVPYAARTADQVELGLDEYAAAWIAARTDACTATHVRHEQSPALMDRRMACLDSRRHALAAWMEVLSAADAQVLERASQATRALPSLAACSNADYLLAVLEPPPAESATEVDEVRQQLARARVLDNAGHPQESVEVAREAHEHALSLGYAPLVAEALLRKGTNAELRGEFDAAESLLTETLALALAHRHDETAASAAQRLIHVIGVQQAKYDEGLRWATVSRSLYQRLGLEHDRNVTTAVDMVEANVLFRMGAYRRAGALYEHAIMIIEDEYGAGDLRLVAQLANLGNVLVREDRLLDALAAYQRAGRIATAELGATHPNVAVTRAGASHVLSELDRGEEAELEQRAAIEIFRASLGPDHPNVIAGECNLGILSERRGEITEALASFERCQEHQAVSYGPDHPETARVLYNLGRLRIALGQLEPARDELTRALAIQRAAYGPEHDAVAATLLELGDLEAAADSLAPSLEHYAAALAMLERTGTGAATTAVARFKWARASRRADGPNPAARAAAARAREELGSADVVDTEAIREIDRWLTEN